MAAANSTFTIAVLPGDGIGREVIPPTLIILDALAKRFGGFEFDFIDGRIRRRVLSRERQGLFAEASTRSRGRPMRSCSARLGCPTCACRAAPKSQPHLTAARGLPI